MTVKTFYFNGNANTAIAPGWFGQMLDGVLPTANSPSFGWWPGSAGSAGFFKSILGGNNPTGSITFQASSWIDPTSGPTKGTDGATHGGDSFITPVPLSGTFAAGNWVILLPPQVAGGGANNSGGLLRFRIWAGKNADGSAPRLLTPSTLLTQTITGITPSNPSGGPQFTVTWAAPAVTLNNEYLFFQLEADVTALSGTTAYWGIRGQGGTVTTPDFQPAIAFGLVGIMA